MFNNFSHQLSSSLIHYVCLRNMSSLFHWSDTVTIWTHSIVEPTTILSNLYLIFIAIVYTPPPMKVGIGLFNRPICRLFIGLQLLDHLPLDIRRVRFVFHFNVVSEVFP